MRKIILLAVFLLLGSGSVFAYSPDDQATIQITPAKNWQVVPNVLTDDTTTMKYENRTPKKPIETLTKREEKKPLHIKDANSLISQMADILKNGLTKKGCEVAQPKLELQQGDKFRVWVQLYQCKQVKLSGLQYYIDADPHTIYLLTFTDNDYPFTPQSRDMAEQEVKALVQVCYKDSGCVGMQ